MFFLCVWKGNFKLKNKYNINRLDTLEEKQSIDFCKQFIMIQDMKNMLLLEMKLVILGNDFMVYNN